MSEFLTQIGTGISDVLNTTIDNPMATVAGAATGAVLGGAAVYGVTKVTKRKSRSKSKRSRKKNNRVKRKRRKQGRRTPHTAGKRKDKSRRRIRYTKNGQPYIIVKGGKARFIKKNSAKRSHKLKGGKY